MSALFVVFFVLRLLAVSRFNASTIDALVSSSVTLSVIVQTLAEFLYVGGLLLFALSGGWFVLSARSGAPLRYPTVAMVLSFLLSVLIGPLFVGVVVLLTVLLFVVTFTIPQIQVLRLRRSTRQLIARNAAMQRQVDAAERAFADHKVNRADEYQQALSLIASGREAAVALAEAERARRETQLDELLGKTQALLQASVANDEELERRIVELKVDLAETASRMLEQQERVSEISVPRSFLESLRSDSIPLAKAFLPALIGAAILFLLLVFNTNPWFPAEQVETAAGRTYVGYVLDAGPQWTTVMLDSSRGIRYLKSQGVVRRTPCRTSAEFSTRSLLQIVTGETAASEPEC